MTRNETILVLQTLAATYPHAKVFQGQTASEIARNLQSLLNEWHSTLGTQRFSDVTQAVELYRSSSPPLMPYAREILTTMKINNLFHLSAPAPSHNQSISDYNARQMELNRRDFEIWKRNEGLI